jgi:predicted transcriptional regulator
MEILPVSALSGIDNLSNRQATEQLKVGYSASLTEIGEFEQSLKGVMEKNAIRTDEPSDTERAVIKPLDYINTEAESIVNYAKSAVQSGNELTPSEIVMLTARSHEFMFHCQLTSNIANRTSDGLQQLFRQQS